MSGTNGNICPHEAHGDRSFCRCLVSARCPVSTMLAGWALSFPYPSRVPSWLFMLTVPTAGPLYGAPLPPCLLLLLTVSQPVIVPATPCSGLWQFPIYCWPVQGSPQLSHFLGLHSAGNGWGWGQLSEALAWDSIPGAQGTQHLCTPVTHSHTAGKVLQSHRAHPAVLSGWGGGMVAISSRHYFVYFLCCFFFTVCSNINGITNSLAVFSKRKYKPWQKLKFTFSPTIH